MLATKLRSNHQKNYKSNRVPPECGFFIPLIMSFADQYIAKNRGNYFVEDRSCERADLVVVIPCFDEPDISATISSLANCFDPGVSVCVVVVVNSSASSAAEIKNQNRKTIEEIDFMSGRMPNWLHLFSIDVPDLPSKHAGVGWARKIGMDWAVTHFNRFDNCRGVIISLDADSLVEQNYFAAIFSFFSKETKVVGSTIYFEHPVPDHSAGDGIVLYELYMRYYKHALAFANFPNSIYTVGSCFAVLAGAYVAQGGMNRKKAGEDFYFLHKLSQFGPIGEINSTKVTPSSRFSDRVPFGTGKVLQQFSEGDRDIEKTYPIELFKVLKAFFVSIDDFYLNSDKLSVDNLSDNKVFRLFCDEVNLLPELLLLISNCSSVNVFRKRFFHLFNAFMVLKWLNFALKNGFEKKSLLSECRELIYFLGVESIKIPNDPKLMLSFFRSMDNECINK